jgi:hypothetical protein
MSPNDGRLGIRTSYPFHKKLPRADLSLLRENDASRSQAGDKRIGCARDVGRHDPRSIRQSIAGHPVSLAVRGNGDTIYLKRLDVGFHGHAGRWVESINRSVGAVGIQARCIKSRTVRAHRHISAAL